MPAKRINPKFDLFFKCPKCFKLFDSPKRLECGHTVCEGCMQKREKKSMNCPICKRLFKSINTANIPIDLTMMVLLEAYQSGNMEELEEVIECPGCIMKYEKPLLLPCLHAVCSICIESQLKNTGNIIRCFVCSIVHENIVLKNMPTDVTMIEALKIYHKTDQKEPDLFSMRFADKKELEEIIECPSCMTKFKDPRILPCGDVMCLKCVEENRNGSTKKLKCNVCKMENEVDDPKKLAMDQTVVELCKMDVKFPAKIIAQHKTQIKSVSADCAKLEEELKTLKRKLEVAFKTENVIFNRLHRLQYAYGYGKPLCLERDARVAVWDLAAGTGEATLYRWQGVMEDVKGSTGGLPGPFIVLPRDLYHVSLRMNVRRMSEKLKSGKETDAIRLELFVAPIAQDPFNAQCDLDMIKVKAVIAADGRVPQKPPITHSCHLMIPNRYVEVKESQFGFREAVNLCYDVRHFSKTSLPCFTITINPDKSE